jgi:type IV pilus assembly protein PilV
MRRAPTSRRTQQGSMLLEAIFGILIFSMGILGLVGLQASAMKQSVEGKYRTDAALLANALVGQMWVADRGGAAFITNFQEGDAYTAWEAEIEDQLPGVAGVTANAPTVVIVPLATVAGGAAPPPGPGVLYQATIRVHWQAPGASASHEYVMVTQLR